MTLDPVWIPPTLEAGRALEIAAERHVEHLVVARADELLGVLCTCDLWDAGRQPVGALMSTPPVMISSRATVEEAAALIRGTGVGCLPVVERGHLVGVLTRGDLARLGAIDLSDQTCASCGSHHHVKHLAGYASAFCIACLDSVAPQVSYDELGWGD